MFAIVNMMRITGVEISKNSKSAEQTAISKSFKKHCKSFIHCVRHVGNDELNYFAIFNMMRITGVVISKESKCAKQTAISKSFKKL